MKADSEKTRDELLQELVNQRQDIAAKNDQLARLMTLEAELQSLQRNYEEQQNMLAREHKEYQRLVDDLQLARIIVERSPVILFRRQAGTEARLEYVSDNIRRFGYTPEEFLSGAIHFRDIVHPEDQLRVHHEIESYVEADVEEYTMVYRCLTRDGQACWVEDHTSVVRDDNGQKAHNQGILYDITERREAEAAQRRNAEKYRRIVETAAEGFCRTDTSLQVVEVNEAYCRMTGYTREELIGTTLFEIVTEEFQQYLYFNREALLSQEKREFEGTGVRKDGSLIPLLIHSNNLRDEQGEIIGHVAFITDMTVHKKALELAAEVQKNLMPQEIPQIPGIDIAGHNISCNEVGGDYYDYIWKEESTASLKVVVGDISGHGVDAALLMATARAFFRMRVSQPGTLSEIMSALNEHLLRDVLDSGRFMTMFCLSIDPGLRSIQWVRAGHDSALLYDPSKGTFEELKGEGIALGVIEELVYSEQTRDDLQPGQIVAIGTDGVWEARNMQGEMFGKERFKSCIQRNASSDAHTILNSVYEELAEFTLGCRIDDDATLVIIKFNVPVV